MGAACNLYDPRTREPLLQDDGPPILIRLLGRDSDVFRKKEREIQARRINRSVKRRNKDLTPDDLEQAEKEACELLASVTTGWAGIDLGEGEVDFSEKAAKDLYLDYEWIRTQVDEFVDERSNFFTKP